MKELGGRGGELGRARGRDGQEWAALVEKKKPLSQTYRLLKRGDRNLETDTERKTWDKHIERKGARGTGFSEEQVVSSPTPNTHLITEDLDLADSSVYQALSACSTIIGINLQVQGDTLHPLL